uniref:Uncharacterized protein n=1 Tax=Calcidiscus leptoporus TaxID=127549 RepID=A0A7S0NYA2_9EUKA|mmetsp:Transcript_37885/g.88650  ORF Transcript_37885/g.88650 Transcript_37885/m.88650 type:complete len:228 (+) Transcript_37885:3-686(+)
MNKLQSFVVEESDHYSGGMAVDAGSVWLTWGICVNRISFATHAVLASYELPEEAAIQAELGFPALTPCGKLFCVVYNDHGPEEIFVFEADTLQFLFCFGDGLLKEVRGMAVGGNELFVADAGSETIEVFSFSGVWRRTLSGVWRFPSKLCFMHGRLFMVENDEYGECPRWGERIFVLTAQGCVLQVYTHPDEERLEVCLAYSRSIVAGFDGKLVLAVSNKLIAFTGL